LRAGVLESGVNLGVEGWPRRTVMEAEVVESGRSGWWWRQICARMGVVERFARGSPRVVARGSGRGIRRGWEGNRGRGPIVRVIRRGQEGNRGGGRSCAGFAACVLGC
jgi:hypothetical protein